MAGRATAWRPCGSADRRRAGEARRSVASISSWAVAWMLGAISAILPPAMAMSMAFAAIGQVGVAQDQIEHGAPWVCGRVGGFTVGSSGLGCAWPAVGRSRWAATPMAMAWGCLPRLGSPIGQVIWAMLCGVWPRARRRDWKRAHLVWRADQAQRLEAVQQQAVAEVEVKRVGVGEDQMLGVRGARGTALAGSVDGQGGGVVGDCVGEAVGGGVDPGDVQVGQRGKRVDQGAADMACAPDPELALGLGEGFDHPALQQLRAGECALVAGGCEQAFDGERHRARRWWRGRSGGLGSGRVSRVKTSVNRVTAPPQHWPSFGPRAVWVRDFPCVCSRVRACSVA